MTEPINGNKQHNGKAYTQNRELRSSEISEVISVKPGFIVNWGMFIILILMAGAALLAAFIKVPGNIDVNITFTDSSPADRGSHHAWANIPAGSAAGIQPGEAVYVIDADKKNDKVPAGKIASVASNGPGGAYRVNISFPYHAGITGSNASAKAVIHTGEQSLLNKLFTNLFSLQKR